MDLPIWRDSQSPDFRGKPEGARNGQRQAVRRDCVQFVEDLVGRPELSHTTSIVNQSRRQIRNVRLWARVQ